MLHGCTFLEDSGTHLACALEKGARDLRAAGAQELIVRYETLDDLVLRTQAHRISVVELR